MKKIYSNNEKILNMVCNLNIPNEILYNENPFECGKDLMVFYEELCELCNIFLLKQKITSSFIFDTTYKLALDNIIKNDNLDVKIFGILCKLALDILENQR